MMPSIGYIRHSMHLFRKRAQSVVGLLLLLPVISGAQSATRLRIPGTGCSLAIPAGYTPAATFSGFQNEKTGAFIMLNELPAPLKVVTEGFSEAAMRGRGMKLLKTEPVTVRDKPATMMSVTQEARGTTIRKFLLVFGHGDATTLVTAGFPEGAAVDADSLQLVIRSIECNPNLAADPLEAAPFRLDISGTEFKPVKFVGGSLLYSTDGKVPTDKPVLIAGSSLGKTEISSRRAFAEKRLRQLPGAEKATLGEPTEVTVDGMAGYEIVAEGSGKNGNAALVYEMMLFAEDGLYYVVVGQAAERTPALLETYRKVAKSFKRK
jgi:hypothetical protein